MHNSKCFCCDICNYVDVQFGNKLSIYLFILTCDFCVAEIPYELTVWTADKKGAGTDANVFIQMYGDNGKTEEYQMRNRTDNFERAQVDKFKVRKPFVILPT